MGNVPRQLSADELLQALRVDLAGELEAILVYEAHAMATSDTRVKKVLTHIADEERQHIGELQQLLFMLNPKEEQMVQQGKQAVQQAQNQNFSQPMQ